MGRRVVTIRYQSQSGAGPEVDDYADRIVKYIPTEVVGVWIVGKSLISLDQTASPATLWVWFGFCLIMTAAWTHHRTRAPDLPPALMQILVSSTAFVVWVYALGPPFEGLPIHSPLWGALTLLGFTPAVGLLVPPAGEQTPRDATGGGAAV